MTDEQVDILIIGGGLTGGALMLALAGQGFSTRLVEAHGFNERVSADFDARSLALAPASVRILQMLNVWPHLNANATPISSIHVSQAQYFGRALMEYSLDNPAGFVVEMPHINRALHHVLDHKYVIAPAQLVAIDSQSGAAIIQEKDAKRTITARLVIAADGAQSTVRRLAGLPVAIKNYHQQAIVANISVNRSHDNRAWERFTSTGAMALLPMSEQRLALVWALPLEDANQLMAMSDNQFLKQLQQTFGYRPGRFLKAGKRSVYPLQQAIMPQKTAWPLVFVGNAAHSLHPVAGQGFNLGLRDVAALAQCIKQHGLNAAMLGHYQAMREYDQRAIIQLTDGLIQTFNSRVPGLGVFRSLGLLAFDNSRLLKTVLTHHARGFSGIVPDLVCGIGLPEVN